MTAALFALVGVLLGALGTLAVELFRSSREDQRQRREQLLEVCVDFVSSVERVRQTTWDIAAGHTSDSARADLGQLQNAMRLDYERLRLVSSSVDTQRAGRYIIRYAYGLVRLTRGQQPRDDEKIRHPFDLLNNWIVRFYVSVRVELGNPDAEKVFEEPPGWSEWPKPARTP